MTWDNGCPRTGKHRYATPADVHKAIGGMKRERKLKPYRRRSCKGWHLSSLLHETRPKTIARTIKP